MGDAPGTWTMASEAGNICTSPSVQNLDRYYHEIERAVCTSERTTYVIQTPLEGVMKAALPVAAKYSILPLGRIVALNVAKYEQKVCIKVSD